MAELHLIATATFGLEAVVVRELEALGYAKELVENGRVHFRGDERALARANLWLRAADRVLLRLGRFEARDFGQLFDRTYALPWEEWIGPADAFPVNGRSQKSQLSSVPACQKIVKKAIVEKLRAAHRVRDLPERGAACTVEVALLDNVATLTLDATGPGLHKRGYRPLVGHAPLKETLAAGMVLLSFWRPDRPLADPFCGTGTIPIEAALIARNLAPGLHRRFAAEDWAGLPAAIWTDARTEARDLARRDLDLHMSGTDIDPAALDLARANARRAGVADDIHFQQRDIAEFSTKRPYGCLICNPPYGVRSGEPSEAEAVHRALPGLFAKLETWSIYVLTAFPDFERLVGRPADRRRKLFNGNLECTYYQFFGPRPP